MPGSAPLVRPKFPFRLLITGLLCVGVLAASAWFTRPGPGIECGRLAPLTVLATIAAFLMAICFRQMGRHKERAQRWFLAGCLLLAAISLFTDFRYVRRYRGLCNSVQQKLVQPAPMR
jgi:hypothetical protein